MNQLFIALIAAALLSACSSAQIPTAESTSIAPDYHAYPSLGSYLWQIGDNYKRATEGDCGELSFPSKTSAYFKVSQDGGACIRDQLNPLTPSGKTMQFTPGQVYEFDFKTITHMGVDKMPYAVRLVWQIHQYDAGQGGCALSPITGLYIETSGSGVQTWRMMNNEHQASIHYVEGGVDTWKVQAKIANNSSGWTKMYHDGELVLNETGPNYPANCQAPFANFGPYEWQWGNPKIHDPIKTVAITFDYYEVSQL
ncbi:MAG: hypothetical protein WB810_13730 [Candidatus Cybelea sp.]